jgi:predicted 3-demethylubiquinone-9 3-methyltransferase (glyoxalase superfamily)
VDTVHMSVIDVATCLWFDDDLDEALASYGRIFGDLERTAPDQHDPATGGLLAARWTVAGASFVGIQGGPGPKHTEAMSVYLRIEGGQQEVDRIWDGFLAEGGTASQCGWLTDRSGISWQVVPVELERAMLDPDPARARASYEAMLRMQKIVIADLPS